MATKREYACECCGIRRPEAYQVKSSGLEITVCPACIKYAFDRAGVPGRTAVAERR